LSKLILKHCDIHSVHLNAADWQLLDQLDLTENPNFECDCNETSAAYEISRLLFEKPGFQKQITCGKPDDKIGSTLNENVCSGSIKEGRQDQKKEGLSSGDIIGILSVVGIFAGLFIFASVYFCVSPTIRIATSDAFKTKTLEEEVQRKKKMPDEEETMRKNSSQVMVIDSNNFMEYCKDANNMDGNPVNESEDDENHQRVENVYEELLPVIKDSNLDLYKSKESVKISHI